MTMRMKRWLTGGLLATSFCLWGTASADTNLVFGIYAADERVKMTWQCGSLLEAMEAHMTRSLNEPVVIEVDASESFDEGVEAVVAGRVDFARFPNVERSWVIHPDVPDHVVAAWREAVQTLKFEELTYRIDPHVFVEGGYGHCRELERLADSTPAFAGTTN